MTAPAAASPTPATSEVLAIDYRRAPEHSYPEAIEDVAAVLRSPAAVAGDSAGGYLATMACLRLRDAGDPLPALQILSALRRRARRPTAQGHRGCRRRVTANAR